MEVVAMTEEKDVGQIPEGAEETPEDFDPLLIQANRMPAFLRGSEGAQEHVRPVTEEDAEAEEGDLDWKPVDPGSFTVDS
jgi:hypothetical protein